MSRTSGSATEVRAGAGLPDLPAPPEGREGWPWTAEKAGGPPRWERDGWPRISVVTPSFNQAGFLEATLRSLLLQGYPDLELIVIDGGSTDGSVRIIERYAPWLTYWCSEPDRGQSHAINKGFARATGEIFAWLNSDDIHHPGALWRAAEGMERTGCDIFIGAMDKVEVTPEAPRFVKTSYSSRGQPIHDFPILAGRPSATFHFIQPPMFWRRAVWERTGGLDERYHYVMDLEWCNRALAAGATVETGEEVLASFTLHPGSKSQDEMERFHREETTMYFRLARTAGFRVLPCALATLRPLSRVAARRAAAATRQGRGLLAAGYEVCARILRVARRAALRYYGSRPGESPVGSAEP